MDIYDQVLQLLLAMPELRSWPGLPERLQQSALAQPRDWQLPVIACEASGGTTEQALPAAAAIACLQIGIILVDDMLDEDPRGEYHRIGVGPAANLASAFQAAGLAAITENKALPHEVRGWIVNQLNQMMLVTAYGQQLDVKNPADEAAYWQTVKTKSVPFFTAAMSAGALSAAGSLDSLHFWQTFGALYGEMIQIHDDLNDVMAVPANPDWLQMRSPLPILFAELVDHPERERFLALRQSPYNPTALEEAQTILVRCGAVSYCVDQIMTRWQIAKELIAGASLMQPEMLTALLRPLIDPIEALFTEVGSFQPISTIA